MYNRRYRKCCCQKHFDEKIIETACNNCGTTADYYMANNKEDSCNCGFDQGESFIPSVGLKMGTIYPELVSPYAPGQSVEEMAFIKAMNTVKEGCNKC